MTSPTPDRTSSPPDPTEQPKTTDIVFSRLLLLRWGALGSQLLLITVISVFCSIRLPLAIIALLIVFQTLCNIVFVRFKDNPDRLERMLFCSMLADLSLQTLLLAEAGGPISPLTSLYFIHLVIAALIMKPPMVWSLLVFAVSCFTGLFLLSDHTTVLFGRPLDMDRPQDTMQLIRYGMWSAFILTAVFLVMFVQRIRQSLQKHQQTIASLTEEKCRNEKLASLATLSAGAAHELATPLSLIAVVASEMHRTLLKNNGDSELIRDAQLIRQQVESCKEILYQMTADAGQPMGEEPVRIPLADLLAEVAGCHPVDRLRIINRAGKMYIRIAPRTIQRALNSLIKNAFDAGDGPVTLTCNLETDHLLFLVEDKGSGMDKETLARASEPFYSTKKPGHGMGLGLFLARSVGEQYGGGLSLKSAPGSGTGATLFLALGKINAKT